MSCRWFENYEKGKIAEVKFRAHAEECQSCRKNILEDEELLYLSRSLREKPIQAPFLWTRIDANLREAQVSTKKVRWTASFWLSWTKIAVSVAALFVILAGTYFLFRPGLSDSTLLTEAALRRVDKREWRYERSIEKLQERVLPQLPDMGLELMLLYRDRIETIDEQIQACKEALLENPGNTHIRKYMLAAFKDKRETLREISGKDFLKNSQE